MIHYLSFSNFLSFKDKVVIDFTVDKHAPDTDAYITNKNKDRISKLMTVIGANASGKTNLLKSLIFLKWFIVDSFSKLGPNDKINYFEPFLFCSQKDVSTLETVFEIEDVIYRYELKLTKEYVVKEALAIKNTETNRWNAVFSREIKKDVQEYDSDYTELNVPSDFEKIVRKNSSVISAAKQIDNPQAIKIVDFFSRIQSNFDNGNSTNRDKVGLILGASEFFQSHPQIKERAEKMMRRFDLGLSKLEITEVPNPNGPKLYFPITSHKNSDNDGETNLTMIQESGGTQNLFVLLKEILAALESGDTVVFDELDNNLHPLMVPELVSLFRSKNHNPKDAQLFFTTHNVQILNELDKQQIVIVEKNDKNISEAWKLSDIQGVRPGDNYYSKYLAGFFGGIPNF